MILEGFEIENWSCIKHLAMAGLPPTGVVVLHGPNGTGKSSILAALRACLMDYPANSQAKDLKRWFPKNGDAKPRVSVTFHAQGRVWRITKQFGSRDSKLESRTPAGGWKAEQSTAADAHEQTRRLVGDKDSHSGLQQLLWLTQTEFRLPEPKSFDSDVQSQLRSILGVLQTPLDDRFLCRVKEEWSRWFGARSKPGEKPKLKKDCPLDKAQMLLEKHRGQLADIESQYGDFEAKMGRADGLEVQIRDLRRQLDDKTPDRDALKREFDESRLRIERHNRAVDDVGAKERTLGDARAQGQRRLDAEREFRDMEGDAERARQDAEEKTRRLRAAEQRLRELRKEVQTATDAGRALQTRLNAVKDRREFLVLHEQAKAGREKLEHVEESCGELENLKRQARERAAPDVPLLKQLEGNRTKAARLRAELDAAAISLILIPDPGASAPRLAIDGAPFMDATLPGEGGLIRRSIRRRAETTLPGWGRAEITRGSDKRSLDQIEDELNELERAFAEAVAPFGFPAMDGSVLDCLRALAADKQVRDAEIERKAEDIDRLAPRGLDRLREEVAGLEKKLHAFESALASILIEDDLPVGADGLEQLGGRLHEEIETCRTGIDNLEEQVHDVEREIEGVPDGEGKTVKKTSKAREQGIVLGLRQLEASAKEAFAGLNAAVDLRRDQLDRMPTAEQIDGQVREAQIALDEANRALQAAKLSESEETIRERLEAADEGLRALYGQLTEAQKELHQIHGAMSQSEGLHQKRAAAAARVEELAARTEREKLDSEAFDRLYSLFEECRQKQLGTVMGPIHARVLRWMRLLRIGDYQSICFNDQFLPEKLVASDGASEMPMGEESTGTIEQLALMVRLALGSLLATPEAPVVAMLDDPLTHSDRVRLDMMRAVLKSASAGDAGSTPPAGPMQIVVFTCHPEWFAIDGAKIVDLSKTDVLKRSCL
jgi:DNA repair exonuclease SbcCD ATPase subunit